MTVKTGGAWAGTFVTKDATGALATPTAGPAGALYVDGTANGATVTITGSNPYKWAVTLPSLTAGQRVDMYITATIATIATAAVVASEQADTSLLSDGVAVASIATDAITADAIKTDAITEIQNGLATAVWAASTRTLTQSAASVTATVSGSDITCTRGDSLSASLTDVGALTGYSKVYFTVKRDHDDADSVSIIQIEKTAGLKYINGAAATSSSNGSLTIGDEATGDITIALDEVETAKLSAGVYYYDVQIVRTAGTVSTLTSGEFTVSADVTRATT